MAYFFGWAIQGRGRECSGQKPWLHEHPGSECSVKRSATRRRVQLRNAERPWTRSGRVRPMSGRWQPTRKNVLASTPGRHDAVVAHRPRGHAVGGGPGAHRRPVVGVLASFPVEDRVHHLGTSAEYGAQLVAVDDLGGSR